jgi:hypothetical protein
MGYDYDELGISAGFGVSGFILVLSTCICIYYSTYHVKHIVYPEAQYRLFPYLISPVVIGWLAWGELMMAHSPPFLKLISDLYTSITVICFVGYVFKMIGGVSVGEEIEYNKVKMERSFIINKSVRNLFTKIEMDSEENVRKYILRIWIFVYQFAAVVVITSIIGLISRLVRGDDLYEQADTSIDKVFIWLAIIRVISSILAISRLKALSSTVSHISSVSHIKLSTKITAVQLSIMIQSIQALVISICIRIGVPRGDGYDSDEKAIWTTNTLICSEMLVLAFIMILLFPMKDYDRLKGIFSPINTAQINRSTE